MKVEIEMWKRKSSVTFKRMYVLCTYFVVADSEPCSQQLLRTANKPTNKKQKTNDYFI